MTMSEQVEQDVWREARNILQRWGELSAQIEALITEDKVGQIAPLLKERQQLSDQMDALRERHGITSWVVKPASGNLPAEMAAEQEAVGAILKRLIADDERIRQAMREKLMTLARQIDQVREMREANLTYRSRRHNGAGAFIDIKR